MLKVEDLWNDHRLVFSLIYDGQSEEEIAASLGWDLDVVQRITKSRMGMRKRGIEVQMSGKED
jgi:hypothetical protein|tara:strand:- start:1298 stop:1486 length:189 start_codon:yes stop_codon:yes gene_type:complete